MGIFFDWFSFQSLLLSGWSQDGLLSAVHGQCTVGLVPLLAQCTVNEDDAVLSLGLGADT